MRKITLFISMLLFTMSWAADFTPGNIVVYRVGDGAAALTNGSTAAFIDEYTATGTLVQSIALPTSGTNMLTNGGTSSSEGQITLSPDKYFITLSGYNVAPGTASLSATASSTVNRKIMTVDNTGNIVDVLLSSTAYSANNIRSAVKNGDHFWAAGTGATAGTNGIQYFGKGTPGQVSSTVTNTRVVNIQNNQLYFSTGSGALGVYKVGTGIPTGTGETATVLITTGTGSSPYAFAFNSASTVCYIADDRTTASGGIQKWTSTDGTTWTLAYTINPEASTGARGVTVDWSGANPIIYATFAGTATPYTSKLYKIEDTGATSTATAIATASTNTVFRGVAFAPIKNNTNNVSNPVLSSMKVAGNKITFGELPQTEINIFSVTGTKVASYSPSQSIQLDIQKGVYIVRVDGQSAKIMLK